MFRTGACRAAGAFDSDDRALVAACLARNDQAIRQLIATHRPAIARLTWALLGRDEVEDVCQDVYLRVFRRLSDFEYRSRLGTWIYRVALNVIRNRQRTARRRRRDAHLSLDDGSLGEHAERLVQPATAEALTESHERTTRIRTAIRTLPIAQRHALVLWTYCDCSHAAIARSTGLSVADVRRTLRLARHGVRMQMEGPTRCARGTE